MTSDTDAGIWPPRHDGAVQADTGADPRRPAWMERVPSNLAGRPTDRLIFIFRAPGCTYARRPEGGCSMCGFAAMTLAQRGPAENESGAPVRGAAAAAPAGTLPGSSLTPADLIAQFDSVFADPAAPALDGIGEVDLYNSGSFFADEEMPPAVRIHVFSRLGRLPIDRVLVESRPEFITHAGLEGARRALGRVSLEVGIGLESADDHVRERLIRKGFDRPAFERAAAALAKAGAGLLVNVLLKPHGLEEQAAIDDALATGRYVFDLARRLGLPARVALQPVFVAPGTPLEREFLAGRYLPASLWSVIAVVRGLHPLGEMYVGLSEEGLGPKRAPAGCGLCDEALRQALRDYNRTRSLGVFDSLSCACQARSPARI